MRWILLDVAIALLALALMAVLVLGLWRRVKALSREVGRAGRLVGEATDDLSRLQADGPLGGPAPNDLHTAYASAPTGSAPPSPVTPRTSGRHRTAPR